MEHLRQYLAGRVLTIEASIAAEVLAGNAAKEACERTALVEVEAFLCEIDRVRFQEEKGDDK